MFEAGFFGTIEDLFLGAKGGVENMGRSISNKLMTETKGRLIVKNVASANDEEYEYAQSRFIELLNSYFMNNKRSIETANNFINSLYCSETIPAALDDFYPISQTLLSRPGGIAFITQKLYNDQSEAVKAYRVLLTSEFNKKFGCEEEPTGINDSDFMKGLKENPLQYFETSDDIKNIISDIDSGKISPEKGFEMLKQLPNPNIVLDMRKLIDDADCFMKAMKTEIPESISEEPVKTNADKEKETGTLEEAITSTGIGKRLFSKMEETPAVAG